MVKRVYILLLALSPIIFATGCNELDFPGMIYSSSGSVESRFAESISWNLSHESKIKVSPSDTYTMYVGTDCHVDKTYNNLSRFLEEEKNDPTSIGSFMLGDLGQTYDLFPVIAEMLADSYVIVGNHDMYFNRWEEFRQYFGTSTYCITVITPKYQDLIIMLDSANGTLGSSQMKWLRNILLQSRAAYRHCIVCTHVNLFKTDNSQQFTGNMPIAETFELCALFDQYDVEICLQGHDHYREELIFKGVEYIDIESMEDASAPPAYLLLTVGSDITHKFQSL
ncbi:MAG: metallophosphoesterase [Bacteroidales bacterium]|nr:metallophosphoesterase [Bacteroidales bacterium]